MLPLRTAWEQCNLRSFESGFVASGVCGIRPRGCGWFQPLRPHCSKFLRGETVIPEWQWVFRGAGTSDSHSSTFPDTLLTRLCCTCCRENYLLFANPHLSKTVPAVVHSDFIKIYSFPQRGLPGQHGYCWPHLKRSVWGGSVRVPHCSSIYGSWRLMKCSTFVGAYGLLASPSPPQKEQLKSCFPEETDAGLSSHTVTWPFSYLFSQSDNAVSTHLLCAGHVWKQGAK